MKDFKRYYILNASPEEVYLALTNPITIKLWTSEEAIMSTIPDADFSLWDGSITGKNISFIENKQIVQQWYFDGASDDSIVTIKLHVNDEGTSVEVRHTNIPDEDFADIVEGWDGAYMGALQDFYSD